MTPKKKPQTSKQKSSIRRERLDRLVFLVTRNPELQDNSFWTQFNPSETDNKSDSEIAREMLPVFEKYISHLRETANKPLPKVSAGADFEFILSQQIKK